MALPLKKHLEFIYGDTDSFITVATKKEGNFNSHYHFQGVEATHLAIVERMKEDVDIYTSHATFSRPKRGKATLWHINTLFADLDCHIAGQTFDLDVLMYYLETEFFNVVVPRPSVIIHTGRGLQLYWKIEEAPKQVLPLWELVEVHILQALDKITDYVPPIRVDSACKDITRITRTPNTVNQKSRTEAYIVYQEFVTYRLHDIIEGYFPELHITEERREEIKANEQKKKTKKKARAVKVSKTVIKVFNAYTLSYQRSVDLIKLLELRGGDVKGYRDEFLYIYVWTVIEKHSTLEDVERELAAVNSLFKEPMSDAKVRAKAKHVYNKFQSQVLKRASKGDRAEHRYYYYDRYVFRNETIIKRLNITEAEQKEMTTIISTREKYDRNNAKRRNKRRDDDGLTKREKQAKSNLETVKELLELGYKQKDIVEATGLSKGQVSKLVKKIKTEE